MKQVWLELWPRIGLDGWDAVAVALSTVVIYGVFVLLIRLLGQRSLARLSGFDVAATVALGAITGRVTLGHTPTLAAGLIALVTLLAVEAVLGELRRFARLSGLIDNRPTVLLIAGRVNHELARRAHVVEDEIRSAIRRAGLHTPADAALVVLERTGDLSVIRAGRPIDRRLLAGIRGADLVPETLLAPVDPSH